MSKNPELKLSQILLRSLKRVTVKNGDKSGAVSAVKLLDAADETLAESWIVTVKDGADPRTEWTCPLHEIARGQELLNVAVESRSESLERRRAGTADHDWHVHFTRDLRRLQQRVEAIPAQ